MKLKDQKITIRSAGGFFGGHLVKSLLNSEVEVVRTVDTKPVDELRRLLSQCKLS